MDIDGARVMFGKEGKVDRIDIVPEPGVDEAELAKRIEAAIGSGLRVERKENQVRALSRMVEGYQGILSFFSVLALLIGMFLVANTVAVAVSDRRREIAVLRAIGASRAGVLSMFVIEAVLMGIIGAAIGVVAGRGLAGLLIERVSASMSRQYITPIDVSEIELLRRPGIAVSSPEPSPRCWPRCGPRGRRRACQGSEAFGAGPTGARTEGGTMRRTMILRLSGVAMLASFGLLSLAKLPAAAESLKPVLGVRRRRARRPRCSCRSRCAGSCAPSTHVARWAGSRAPPRNSESAPPSVAHRRQRAQPGHRLDARRHDGGHPVQLQDEHRRLEPRTFVSDVWSARSGACCRSTSSRSTSHWRPRSIRFLASTSLTAEARAGSGFVHHMYEGRQITIKAYDKLHPRIGSRGVAVIDRSPDAALAELYDPARQGCIISQNFAAHFGKKTGDILELIRPDRPAAPADPGASPSTTSVPRARSSWRATYKKLWQRPAGHRVCRRGQARLHGRVGSRDRRAVRHARPRGDAERGSARSVRPADGRELRLHAAIELAALVIGLLALLSALLVSLLARHASSACCARSVISRGQLARMILGEAALLGLFGGLVAARPRRLLAKLWVVSTLATSLGWFIQVYVPLASISARRLSPAWSSASSSACCVRGESRRSRSGAALEST